MKTAENRNDACILECNGKSNRRRTPLRQKDTEQRNGQVIFPFRNTKVHSDAWRASDHVTLLKEKDAD